MDAKPPTGTEERTEPMKIGAIVIEDTHRLTLALAQIRELEKAFIQLQIERLICAVMIIAMAVIIVRRRNAD